MLELPKDWSRTPAGYVATRLLRQAEAIGEYPAAARLFARACMELLRDTRLWPDGPAVRFEERVIRITDYAWLIAGAADDQLVPQVVALANSAREVRVVCPPWARALIGDALSRRRTRGVLVDGLDAMVSLRVFFTSGDLGADSSLVLSELLCRYSELCLAHDVPQLRVECGGLGRLPADARLARGDIVTERRTVSAPPVEQRLPRSEESARFSGLDDDSDNGSGRCELCQGDLEGSNDECAGLCPECADIVSNLLDDLGLTDEHFDQVVGSLHAVAERIADRKLASEG